MLHYNPETGVLVWKTRNSKRVNIGDVAGCVSPDGRVLIGINKKLYKAHRVIWAMVTGEWPTNLIDHKNGNPSDNRFENLREATKSQNQMNIKRIASNSSGIKGVSWSKASQKWRATIMINGKSKHLGVFATIEEASEAYKVAAQNLHGEFAAH